MSTITTDLPPDPDARNGDRAEWARQTLEHFQELTRTDLEDALADLLCDLAHFCDREGVSSQHEFRRAIGMYEHETEAEGDQFSDITLRAF
jgi:hypothetical protein